ncbi:hypothetical protein FPJ27_26535 [Burkholderia sp. MS455]|uniref:hypothetical protein n=1 Tax=Burkholderia sp. MS455 TaxID=2811788 RepID=UPI0019566FD4|nr:hypothetical protein [Burkholderia sp. MS455]QRR09785.1 hypothetical protein FPJ27_26535 [Burkholderia sp. MS455]
MLNVQIRRPGDLSRVANGPPRADVLPAGMTFADRTDYILRGSTRLPDDFVIGRVHRPSPHGSRIVFTYGNACGDQPDPGVAPE